VGWNKRGVVRHMNKKYKILLHLGLAKTATSSLQTNVFLKLHNTGEINFLGVSRASKFYPFSNISRSVLSKKLSKNKLNSLRKQANQMLTSERLNVLSEEIYSHSMLFDLNTTFSNLKEVLSDCDIKVLVSLRTPVDELFSYYVESYYMFRHTKENTFELFDRSAINSKHREKYLQFSYEDYLSMVSTYFTDLTVILYEDLVNDKKQYFQSLYGVFNIGSERVRTMFLSERRNTKEQTNKGKRNKDSIFVEMIKARISFVRKSKYKAESIWIVSAAWNLLSRLISIIDIKKPGEEHQYPEEKLAIALRRKFGVDDIGRFSKKYNLNLSKLRKYGYSSRD